MTLRERLLPGRHPRLQVFLFGIVFWCVGLFVYGFVTYPDVPYKPCGNWEYCGKRGSARSLEEFQSWQRWEGLLIASWPFGMLAGVALGRLRKDD